METEPAKSVPIDRVLKFLEEVKAIVEQKKLSKKL